MADEQAITIVVEPLPYPFADGTHGSLWMWVFENVMQHSETPLTPKTLDFIDDAYERVLARIEGRVKSRLEVVK